MGAAQRADRHAGEPRQADGASGQENHRAHAENRQQKSGYGAADRTKSLDREADQGKDPAPQFRRDDGHAQRLGPDRQRRIEEADEEQPDGGWGSAGQKGDECDRSAREQ